MNSPKVSVIIPVFNPGNLLINCLNSVLNQTMMDIEIICVDDGSDDNSYGVLENFKKSDSRLKVFHQENLGAGSARNMGIEHSTGEFILFVDSDDFIEKDTCQCLYDFAKKLDVELVLFNAVRHTENGNDLNLIYFRDTFDKKSQNFFFDYNFVKDKVFDGYFGVIWNKFYKASFIKNNGITFPKHKIYNDVEFHIKTMILAQKIAYIPRIFYHYNRIGQDSLQKSFVKTKYSFVFFDVLEGILTFLTENNFYDEFKIPFFEFSIFELKNKYNSVENHLKEDHFKHSHQFFNSLDLSVDDLNDIKFEYFLYFVSVINSDNFSDFKAMYNIVF